MANTNGVVKFLNKGANINAQLMMSICENNVDEVVKLLNKGADINYDHGQPLKYYIQKNNIEVVRLLLDMGSNPNIDGGAPLIYACSITNYKMVELLLNEGIDYDKERYGTLIDDCIYNDDVDSLKLLIQFDIIDIINDECYESPWKICLRHKALNMIEFIIDNYPEMIHDNETHIRQEDIDKYNFIKMLVDRNLIDVAD